MIRKDAVKNFCGRISSHGVFEVLPKPEAPDWEEHLGYQLLIRGYIAARADLRRRFGLEQGLRSDGELLAHAFRAWGSNLQAHVLGEYAVVVYDPIEKTGLLTHDALGLTPLFYSQRSGGVAFSTRINHLVDASSAQSLDEEFLADFLVRGSSTTERTPYSSIQRLMPGRSLWWSGRQLKQIQTWRLDDLPTVLCKDDGEYEERFRILIGDGIKAATSTEGPTWIALSGGLDSSAVASVAAHGGAHQLAAYSVISPGWPDVDEQRWMRAVVEQYALPWHPVDVEAVLPFSRLPGEFLGEPTESVIDSEMLRVQNVLLSAHGAEVMLTGDGGDIVLGASRGEIPIHLADLLFNGKPIQAIHAMSTWRRESGSRRSHSYWMLKSLAEPAANYLLRKRNRGADLHALPPWIDPAYAREMRLVRREEAVLAPICRVRR
jgi:asparagine synthase (glutamine-hydrolysing)